MLKKLIQKELGHNVSDIVLTMATQDIKVNRINFGKRTSLKEAIKIAARCAETLQKCGNAAKEKPSTP